MSTVEKDFVQTAAGARRYGLPIGSPIPPGSDVPRPVTITRRKVTGKKSGKSAKQMHREMKRQERLDHKRAYEEYMARRAVAKARDGDGDGFVNDGTPMQRAAIPSEHRPWYLKGGHTPKKRKPKQPKLANKRKSKTQPEDLISSKKPPKPRPPRPASLPPRQNPRPPVPPMMPSPAPVHLDPANTARARRIAAGIGAGYATQDELDRYIASHPIGAIAPPATSPPRGPGRPSSTRWGARVSSGGKPIREASKEMVAWRTPIDANAVTTPPGMTLKKLLHGGKIGTSIEVGGKQVATAHWNGTGWVMHDDSGAKVYRRFPTMQSVIDYAGRL